MKKILTVVFVFFSLFAFTTVSFAPVLIVAKNCQYEVKTWPISGDKDLVVTIAIQGGTLKECHTIKDHRFVVSWHGNGVGTLRVTPKSDTFSGPGYTITMKQIRDLNSQVPFEFDLKSLSPTNPSPAN